MHPIEPTDIQESRDYLGCKTGCSESTINLKIFNQRNQLLKLIYKLQLNVMVNFV